MAIRLFDVGITFLDNNGNPLSGGTIDFFAAGSTSTRQDTYADHDENTTNTNPYSLDGYGRIPTGIWINPNVAYNVIVKASDGTTIASMDDVAAAVPAVDGSDAWDYSGGATATALADMDFGGFDARFDDGTGIRDDSDNEVLIFSKSSSAVNYSVLSNSATGNAITFVTAGGDSNIPFTLTTKGAGALTFEAGTGNLVLAGVDTKIYGLSTIYDDNDNEALEFVSTASAVNHFQLTNATDASPTAKFAVIGDSTNISIQYETKAAAQHQFISAGDSDSAILRIYDNDSSAYIGLTVPDAVSSSVDYILPEDGSDGQVLTTDGSGALSWGSVSATIDVEHINTITVSNDSVVDITDLDYSTYKQFKFIFRDIRPASSVVDFYMRTSDNNGSSFASTLGYAYTRLRNSDSTIAVVSDEAESKIFMCTSINNETDAVLCGEVTYFVSDDGNDNLFTFNFVHNNPGFGEIRIFWGSGHREDDDPVDAVRFFFSSGNMDTGYIDVYGYRVA